MARRSSASMTNGWRLIDRRSLHPLRRHRRTSHQSSAIFPMDIRTLPSASRQTESWTGKKEKPESFIFGPLNWFPPNFIQFSTAPELEAFARRLPSTRLCWLLSMAPRAHHRMKNRNFFCHRFRNKSSCAPSNKREEIPLHDYANGMEIIFLSFHCAGGNNGSLAAKQEIDLLANHFSFLSPDIRWWRNWGEDRLDWFGWRALATMMTNDMSGGIFYESFCFRTRTDGAARCQRHFSTLALTNACPSVTQIDELQLLINVHLVIRILDDWAS